MPVPLFLYSTNPYIKLLIEERFREDKHYAWCSESFDSAKQPGYSASSLVAASSNPASLYKELREGCKRGEKHCSKIGDTRTRLKALAVEWEQKGEISSEDKEEIILLADDQDPMYWQPLIYVIPRHLVESRLQKVHLGLRASFGREFIIGDLNRNEFDIISLD
jgi:hypothetical protein